MPKNISKNKRLLIVLGAVVIFLVLIIYVKPGLPPYSRTYSTGVGVINKQCKCLGKIDSEEEESKDGWSSVGKSEEVCLGVPYSCRYEEVDGKRRTVIEYQIQRALGGQI